ncbi:MAG: hypothetical protein WD625_03950 [Balneolales bacterium]
MDLYDISTVLLRSYSGNSRSSSGEAVDKYWISVSPDTYLGWRFYTFEG